MRSYMLLAFLMASVVFVSGCTGGNPEAPATTETEQPPQQLNPPEAPATTETEQPPQQLNPPETQGGGGVPDSIPAESNDGSPAPSSPLWMTAELTDVSTGSSFAIADFEKPVLVESFAVWCPLCTRQQQESKKLEEMLGDSVVSVSINTDPNEDSAQVKQHIQRNGFDWYYAIAPAGVTNSLIDDFGLSITNVPLTPMILVCPGDSVHRLRNGVKSADELAGSISELCGA